MNFQRALIFLLLIISDPLFAQDSTPVNFGIKGHKGFILVHRENMSHLVTGHPHMLELTATLPTFGEKHWQQIYLNPELGMSFFYVNLASPALGNAYVVIPHVNFPLTRGNTLKLTLRAGTGVAYLTKKYDRVNNHKNNAASTHLNGAVNFQLEKQLFLTQALSLRTGIAFTHFSNGSYKMPNLGINIVTINTGINYTIGKMKEKITSDSLVHLKNPYRITFLTTGGVKSLFVLSDRHPAFTFNTTFEKLVSHKSSFGLGLDLVYNPSLREKIYQSDGITISNTELIQTGMHLAYNLNVDKLSLFFNKGIYMKQADSHSGLFYHRIGVRYRINDKFVTNFSLKSHFGVADYFEYGFGYSFRK
ncbi:MAG: acyloxyacyl hydrolase [Bacteroidetes bacterium]|nr:acyloxyacyl hydrolase [Bacteroidota bacterium]